MAGYNHIKWSMQECREVQAGNEIQIPPVDGLSFDQAIMQHLKSKQISSFHLDPNPMDALICRTSVLNPKFEIQTITAEYTNDKPTKYFLLYRKTRLFQFLCHRPLKF